MKTFIVLLALLSLTGTSDAGPIRRIREIKSDPSSPVLTSVVEQRTTVDSGELILIVTGLTAAGKTVTLTDGPVCWTEETYHLKYMTDSLDGYWTACSRILLEEGGKTYIVGYREEEGDSDDVDDDTSSAYSADVPFDFDLATQTFRIRAAELTPLPTRFCQVNWTGVRFLVPVNLVGLSKGETETIVQSRGGCIVGSEGPVDVVVLPDRVDFCPDSSRGRNRPAIDSDLSSRRPPDLR